MSSMLDLTGTIKEYFSLNNKATLLQGNGAPDNANIGKVGDLYFRLDTGVLYFKHTVNGENRWDYLRYYTFPRNGVKITGSEETGVDSFAYVFADFAQHASMHDGVYPAQYTENPVNPKFVHDAIQAALTSSINYKGVLYPSKTSHMFDDIENNQQSASVEDIGDTHTFPTKVGDVYIVTERYEYHYTGSTTDPGFIFQVGDMIIMKKVCSVKGELWNSMTFTEDDITSQYFDYIQNQDDENVVIWHNNQLEYNNGSKVAFIDADNNIVKNLELDTFKKYDESLPLNDGTSVITNVVHDVTYTEPTDATKYKTNQSLPTEKAVRNAIEKAAPYTTSDNAGWILSVDANGNHEWRDYIPGFPLFYHQFLDYEIYDYTWVKSDGSWITKSAHPSAYNLIKNTLDGASGPIYDSYTSDDGTEYKIKYYRGTNGMKICYADQLSTLNSLFENMGHAWYYVIDTTASNEKFIVPRSRLLVKGDANFDNTDVGNYVKFNTGDVYVENGGNADTINLSFNKMYLYFYVGGAIINESRVDLNEVVGTLQNEINKKANIDSPSLTGSATAPTLEISGSNITNNIATTSFVNSLIDTKLVAGTNIAITNETNADGIVQKKISSTINISDYALSSDVSTALESKADKSDTFTKTEINNKLSQYSPLGASYTKSETYSSDEIDNKLADNENASTTYTDNAINDISTQITTLTSNITSLTTTVNNKANTSDVYDKTAIDDKVTELEEKIASASVDSNVNDVTIDGRSIVNNLKNAVIPLGSNTTYGVFKVSNDYGTQVDNNYLATIMATDAEIEEKTHQYHVIVPANLDDAIKAGLGNNSLTWTDTEQTNARTTIDAQKTLNTVQMTTVNSGISSSWVSNVESKLIPTPTAGDNDKYLMTDGNIFFWNDIESDVLDEHIADTDIHVTTSDKDTWNAKVSDVKIGDTSIVSDTVASIPLASNDTFGVVKVGDYGVLMNTQNSLAIDRATESDLSAKTNNYKSVVPSNLDLAIKAGLGNNSLTWTDTEQTNARTTINAQKTLTTAQQNAVDSGITSSIISTYNTHISDTDIHVTTSDKDTWNAKQNALSSTQMDAVNSGATASIISSVANKADKATTLAGYGIGDAYTKTEVDNEIASHNTSTSAHSNIFANYRTSSAQDTIDSGKVDKVSTANKVYGTDADGNQTTYDATTFGQVDDVKVNGTSVVTNKIANITIDAQVNADWNATSGAAQILNKPTIPVVNNATLTIQKNGTAIDTFTANASSDKTINITVPTSASDVNALPSSTKYGSSIDLSINDTTYVITAQLKDQDGNNLGNAKTIDLPLESVVVSGSYNDTTKKIVLTLQSGSTVEFSVADLVSGLQSEITSSNKLSASLVSGLATVATSGSYNDLDNKPTIPAAQVNSDWNATSGVAQILNKPTLAAVATSGSYSDLSNKPTIPTVNNATLTIQKNGTDVTTFTANSSTNATANITVPTTTSELTNNSGFITNAVSDLTNYRTASAQDTIDSGKQATLVSGTNIKTINNQSLLGSGNLTIEAGEAYTESEIQTLWDGIE